MQTVRRLYLYLISGVTLALVAVGLALLGEALMTQLGIGRGTLIGGDPSGTRVQVSQAIALIGVGLPVWLLHWWLVERALRPGSPAAEAERNSTVRAVYLTLVFVVTLLAGINSGTSLLRSLGHAVIGGGSDFGPGEPSVALPAALVSGLVWLYHWLLRRRDLRVGPTAGAAAWVPRLYVYGAAAFGLSNAMGALGDIIGLAVSTVAPGRVVLEESTFTRGALVDVAVPTLAWGAVWLGHWWYALRATRGDGYLAVSEAFSRVRLAYLVGIVAFAAARALLELTQAGRAVMVILLGAENLVGDAGPGAVGREIVTPLLMALAWGSVAWLHLRWVRREAQRPDDSDRPLRVERLTSHALSLVGLAFGAAGIAWLVGLAIDVALGGGRTVGGDGFWRLELSQFVPLAVLGAGLWLWEWRGILARYAGDRNGEARSTTRRGALLLPMAGAVLAGLAGAAVVLYRFVAAILGADVSGNLVSELSTPLGVLVVAVAVAANHGLLLRADLGVRVAPTAEGQPPSAPAATEAPLAELPGPTRRLVLAGPPGADLEAALAALRGVLPEGHSLDDTAP